MKSALATLRKLRAARPATVDVSAVAGGDSALDLTAVDSLRSEGGCFALRVASRLLGEDVMLVSDDATADALERELEGKGESMLVFTLAEVFAMQAMLATDMRTIAKLKRTLAGAGLGGRVESVVRREGSA